MNLAEELKNLCVYVMAVAEADLPDQLKYELIFEDKVAGKIEYHISLGALYGHVDQDWESHGEEVREFAAACEKLYNDLEKIRFPSLEHTWV